MVAAAAAGPDEYLQLRPEPWPALYKVHEDLISRHGECMGIHAGGQALLLLLHPVEYKEMLVRRGGPQDLISRHGECTRWGQPGVCAVLCGYVIASCTVGYATRAGMVSTAGLVVLRVAGCGAAPGQLAYSGHDYPDIQSTHRS